MKPTKEMQEEFEKNWRDNYPLPSEERSKAIIEASKSITLDDHNPESQWTFSEGECPFSWYDAQIKAINHFGHVFCINPFYDNFSLYTGEGRRLAPDEKPWFHGWEFKSTEELISKLKSCKAEYLDMTLRTIKYLKLNCEIEFPNGWADQFDGLTV